MTANPTETPKGGNLIPDPVADKDRMKEMVADSVTAELGGGLDDEGQEQVRRVVDETYEDLLARASVTNHLAPLTKGAAKRKVKGMAV